MTRSRPAHWRPRSSRGPGRQRRERPGPARSGLDQDTAYQLRVVALGSGGESAPSTAVKIHTRVNSAAAPTELKVKKATSTAITLDWKYAVPAPAPWSEMKSFVLYRDQVQITAPGHDVREYADTGLTPGTSYYYELTAVSVADDSESDPAGVDAETHPKRADDPANLRSASTRSLEVDLVWDYPDVPEIAPTAFQLDRRTLPDGSWEAIAPAIAPDARTYQDTTTTAGTAYEYQLIAQVDDGEPSDPATVQITTP